MAVKRKPHSVAETCRQQIGWVSVQYIGPRCHRWFIYCGLPKGHEGEHREVAP